jgi:hypothetical protein
MWAKIWAWLKKNWKWLVLPLWVLSLLLMWFLSGGHKTFFPPSGTTDEAADEAMKAKDEAMKAFRARLDELARKAEERLQGASEEQVKELKELQDKPLDEVAKWIDSLS